MLTRGVRAIGVFPEWQPSGVRPATATAAGQRSSRGTRRPGMRPDRRRTRSRRRAGARPVLPYGRVPFQMNAELKITRSVERANQLVRRYLTTHLDRLGVSDIEAHLLARLAAKGPCTVADVQRAFGLRASTLSNALDRLDRRGLLTRQSHPDRKSVV